MKTNKREKKKFYVTDPKNNDFAKMQIKADVLGDDFVFYHTNPIYRASSFLIRYLFALPILSIVAKIKFGTKVMNKEVLKEVKHKGYFLYSNHTTVFDIMHHSCLVNPWTYSAFVASHESFSIKGLKHIVPFLGAFPVPKTINQYKKYLECMKWHLSKNHKIVIYPEAHIWPLYTGIREYSAGSFRYPVKLKAPIIVATTVFKERRFRKTPKAIIYLDGPIYPNLEIKSEIAIKNLRDEVFNIMKERTSVSWNYSMYEYVIKKD